MKKMTVLIVLVMLFSSCAGQPPANLGIEKERLAECPDKKNCVSSQSVNKDFFIEPFVYKSSREAAFKKLKKSIESFERFKRVEESETYLRYECTSAVMGFVDDLEFHFPEDKIIHVRSASRVGYSDFGVNRKRVEDLRKLFYSE